MRSFLSLILLGLLAPGRAWCDPAPSPAGEAALLQPVPAVMDSQRVAAHRVDMDEKINEKIAAAYREHAPLALFSLGSLAVGGAFYAIGHGADGSRSANASADRSQLKAVVSVAGISALLAAGSYFYYVHRAKARAEAEPQWDAALMGAPDGAGGIAMGARLTLALSSLR
ncbi:MAG: hypothetical protein JF616_15015 [Fibrobacteres bacterium]|nr:hypothetical protein [Fibrobacterota bacterium]